MRLYHVGFDSIPYPDIHYGRKNADFGQGFYLTDDKEFSNRWAKEKSGSDTFPSNINGFFRLIDILGSAKLLGKVFTK